MSMTEEKIQDVLRCVEEILRGPDVSIEMARSVRRTTKPGDQWESYAPGQGRRILIQTALAKGDFYEFPIPIPGVNQ